MMNLAQPAIELLTRDLGLGGRGAHLVIPSIVGPILAAILVFNRVYWRVALVRTLGMDDLCITLSLIFLFAHCTVNFVAVDYGYGRPSKTLSRHDLQKALQMFYLNQVFYKFTINLTKLSILCLYLRIFSQTWFRRTCWACMGLILSYATASIFATIFQCTPIPRMWNRSVPGTCINLTAFWYANAIYNLVTDFIILASAPPVVMKLKLPLRQRIGLTGVFGLGVFVFTTSILRMTTLEFSSKAPDMTYGTLKSTMWTTIEASTAIVCACLPMVRTPIQRFFPRLFPSSYGTLPASRGARPAHCAATAQREQESGSIGDDTTLTGREGDAGHDLEMSPRGEKKLNTCQAERTVAPPRLTQSTVTGKGFNLRDSSHGLPSALEDW